MKPWYERQSGTYALAEGPNNGMGMSHFWTFRGCRVCLLSQSEPFYAGGPRSPSEGWSGTDLTITLVANYHRGYDESSVGR